MRFNYTVVPKIMNTFHTLLAFIFALSVGTLPVAAAGAAKLELVMAKGDKIIATTEAGRIEITADVGLNRSYTWDGATRSAELEPRTERWYGSMGAYYPGPGEHWKSNNGITRGVLQEGQQHFENVEAAKKWLAQQSKWYSTVFTDSGLVVSFSKVEGRRQINVEVWQIYINGKPPKELQGADDTKLQYLKSKAQSGRGDGIAPVTPPTPPGMRDRTGRFR